MPAFKLTTNLVEKRKLNTTWKELFNGESFQKLQMEKILSAENAKEQINHLKKIQKDLNDQLNISADVDEEATQTFSFLVHVFFISTSKNPIRRVLISYFQNLPEFVQRNTLTPAMISELLLLSQDKPSEKYNVLADVTKALHKNQELRHNVDTVSALIENFALGEECVSSVAIEVLDYLGTLLDQFYRSYSTSLSPVQKNETMHHCMETVKVANRICQRSSVAIETRLCDRAAAEWYMDIVEKMGQSDICILMNDEFLLDCKTTSAMNLCLVLRQTDVGDHLLSVFSQTIFQSYTNMPATKPADHLPDWLLSLDLTRLSRTKLSQPSYLCLCYGVLSMIAIESLLHIERGKCFLLDVLLPEFLDLSKAMSDVGSKLLAAKSLYFLTQRVRTYISKLEVIAIDEVLWKRLSGDSADLKLILDFIWTSWEDSVEAVRFTVKDIFENIVSIHQTVTQSSNQDPFLDSLTISILNDVSWSCKGKYGTLSVLVRHVGSARMLELHPGIADQVLQQLEEQTLSCYVRDLYEELFTNYLKDLNAGGIEGDGIQEVDWYKWFNCWVQPIIKMLCQSTPMQKKHLIEYVLPKVLKTGDRTLYSMITTLTDKLQESGDSPNSQHKGNQLGALIMCVRRARAMGLLRTGASTVLTDLQSSVTSQEKECLFGVVDLELLKYALIIKDEQVRLDAFALLCESQKTTELINGTELHLIKSFIPQNMTNQNPAFRQLMLSFLKKFLSRMRESMFVLIRQSAKIPSNKQHLTIYKEFLIWLTRHMFCCLYPGSTFPRRTTALNTLSLLMDIYNVDRGFSFSGEVETRDVQTLFQCLTDTFEDNKIEASRILIACSKRNITAALLEEEKTRKYFDLALTLGCSSRPQDGLTGAYLLRVLVHQPNMFHVLKTNLKASSFDKDKPDVDGVHKDNLQLTPFHDILDELEDKEDNRQFLLLWVLLKSLEDQLRVARNNLLVAAANNPLYPTMLCMRYTFSDLQFSNIDRRYHQFWSEFFARFISLCFEISEIVSPVVHNCSPEGNIPMEAFSDLSKQTNLREVTDSEQTVMLMPEYLTVCCWRSVKEISLILGQLISDLPPLDSTVTAHTGFLSYSQILSIGAYFTNQLLESKHRGAFELAYTGFVKVTEMLWRSNIPEFHCLPKKWLSEVMTDIVSDDPNSRLCATRRSAGVPFYIQAIVSSEPSATGRLCFKDTMIKLIDLAYSKPSKHNCNPKVHSLNILRMLYKDSRLKDDVTPYLADGLKVAILGFKSNLWAIRNAATLLMAAMMNRIFGVKRSKDESSLSRKNCQTGKTFFFKFPALYQFLLDELSEATENIGTQLHPGLYPILMVLGRLFPSTMEGTDTTLNLAAFIPYVMRCCSSPVLKTRMMAARALQPLVEKDHMITVISDLFTLLPCAEKDRIGQNQIHGVLLQLKYLLNTVPMMSVCLRDNVKDNLCSTWLKQMDFLISRSNPCLLTRTSALEISFHILEKFGENSVIFDKLWEILQSEIDLMSKSSSYLRSSPCLSEFMCSVCELYLRCICTYMNKRTVSSCKTQMENYDMMKNLSQKHQFGSRNDEHRCEDLLSTFEEISVKLLGSRSYDVRRSYLLVVSTLCCHDKVAPSNEVGGGGGETFTELLGPDNSEDSNKEGELQRKQERLLWKLEEVLLRSRKIHKVLLQICLTETQRECQTDLFRLLKVYASYALENKDESSLCLREQEDVVKLWLERLLQTNLSEEVIASCIDYLGVTLPTICRTITSNRISRVSNIAEMEKFIDVLVNFCDAPETAASIQLASAHSIISVLKSNCLLETPIGVAKYAGRTKEEVAVDRPDTVSELAEEKHHIRSYGRKSADKFVTDIERNNQHEADNYKEKAMIGGDLKVEEVTNLIERRTNNLNGGNDLQVREEENRVEGGASPDNISMNTDKIGFQMTKNVYKAMFDLLQVDDLDVKDAVTDIMPVISGNWSRGSPQSHICTSLVMNHWMDASLDPSLVAFSLLQFIAEDTSPEQTGDERLFDRGEMNTFRDEIDLMQHVDEILMKFFGLGRKSRLGISASQEENKEESVSMNTDLTCDESLYNVIQTVISTDLLTCADQDVYLDCSKHEKYVIQVHKVLLCFKYGLMITRNTDKHDIIIEAWYGFLGQLNNSVLPAITTSMLDTIITLTR